ncbi:hypothetical protein CSC75_11620 [Pseudoxanthomonas wuyuanensis]|nr:hypothetical protein CSC75_11620 [Pseudoxanthomonas wuyuanensis]
MAAALAVLVLAASFAHLYLLQPGRPQVPALQGQLQRHVIDHDGRRRSYWLYQPAGSAADAALLLALHGPLGNGHGMRELTARRLDLLADRHGLRVAYPDAGAGGWNGCGVAGPQRADDVGFLLAMVADVSARSGAAPARIHAFGFSDGGAMALRLALHAPGRLASLSMAAVRLSHISVPVGASGAAMLPPMLLINGSADRFEHAECAVGGGTGVAAAHAMAAWLSGGDAGALSPAPHESPPGAVINRQWRGRRGSLRLYLVTGGGHTLPQPYVRYPRVFGPTYAGFDGLAAIAGFIAETNAPSQATAPSLGASAAAQHGAGDYPMDD